MRRRWRVTVRQGEAQGMFAELDTNHDGHCTCRRPELPFLSLPPLSLCLCVCVFVCLSPSRAPMRPWLRVQAPSKSS
jgi:hypothetical protein